MNWGGESYPIYDGEMKGADTAQSQLNSQNAIAQQQLALQQQVLGQVQGPMSQYLKNNIGFTPEQMANLRSQFLNSQSTDFGSAQSQVKQALLQRGEGGGQNPLSGSAVNDIAALSGLQASSTSAGLRDINLANIQQALSNRFNAAGILMGVGGQYGNNFASANSGASNALNSYITGINANTPMGLATGFASGFGQGLGGALGKGAAACWIAEKIWGVGDMRTIIVRGWLSLEFGQSLIGSVLMKLYSRFGRKVAAKPTLVKALKPLFDLALRKAEAWG